MNNAYRLKKDQSEIKIKVRVGTTGNASAVVSRKGTEGQLFSSTPEANGNINKRKIGLSDDLLRSVIVVDLAILLDGIPANQLDQAFENLSFRVTLSGGPEGEQSFDIGPEEKLQFASKKLIVASKEINMIP